MKTDYKLKFILLFMVATLLGLSACDQSQKMEQQNTENKKESSLQTAEQLLEGYSAAVCYSGFRTGQHPDRGAGAVNPSYEEIYEDLQLLIKKTPFRLIRLYDCEENSQMVLEVIRQYGLDIKVMQGIWLRAELSAHETCEWLTEPIPQQVLDENKVKNTAEIAKGIELANIYKDIIVAVNVGNEALVEWNDHMVDTDTIITYVKRVQESIEQPVTVADNYKWWADHGKELAEAVDFVSIHVYPIWENKDIDEAMAYSIENVLEVMQALPEAPIVISEAGWATTASEFGERASEAKQTTYTEALLQWANRNNITTFIFEAFDEDWKGNPADPLGAEKHWGVFKVDRTPKQVVSLLESLIEKPKNTNSNE
ncbi:MAG: glycosyl hydrolase [Bacteroidetes bacterium]|nr:glycosyl hydrolase [Bacteroidota bacterium]MBU1578884.1 glycosyl hydrolase [Bacteroidota bacterium]MBU2466111.1 glycosyl hydrolase [Bacteroidota bacterium]MBU2557931.1 glycosyl hydrolase [Bacteroidota bacterium]